MNFDNLVSSLKELINSEWVRTENESFSQSLHRAVEEREKRMTGITHLFNPNKIHYKDKEPAIEFCKALLNSKVTLLVVGPINSGKSLLTSQLVDFDLPSSDEVTTKTIVRLVYSEQTYSKVKTIQGKGYTYKEMEHEETSKSIEEFWKENFDISMENEDDDVLTIIEIGLPSEILKSGIQIVDCPGFQDSDDFNLRILNRLYLFKPSIICYVYDYNYGFGERDLENISKLHGSLSKIGPFMDYLDFNHCTQYVVVCNKCDQIDSSMYDDEEKFEICPNLNYEYLHKMGRWKLSNQKQFPFDTYRLMPEILLSSADLFRSKLMIGEACEASQEMFLKLQDVILKKIVNQSRYLVDIFGHYLITADIAQGGTFSYVDLFLNLKSACVDPELVSLIESNDHLEDELLFDFHGGYKVYGLLYRENAIQVTSISTQGNCDKLKKKLYKDVACFENSRQTVIYQSNDRKTIFVIDKNIPHNRLLDSLDKFDILQTQDFIKQIVDQHRNLSHYNLWPNFRIDNVYVDEYGAIYINRNIPNNCNTKFLMKNGIQTSTPKIFFNKNENSISTGKNHEKIMSNDIEKSVEFIQTFAWFIWFLMNNEESIPDIQNFSQSEVNNLLHNLEHKRFENCPQYLRNAMKMCWSFIPQNGLEDVLEFWNSNISPRIDANTWIKETSSLIETDLVNVLKMPYLDKNSLLDFTYGIQIFQVDYLGRAVQVTLISFLMRADCSLCEMDFSVMKENIYERRYQDKDGLHYEGDNEMEIYLIDRPVSNVRLLDNLEKYSSLDVIQNLIKNVAEQINPTEEFQLISNFRADCLFVDDEKSNIFINRNVPNNPKLPFFMKNKIATKTIFHIHPSLLSVKKQTDLQFSRKIQQTQKDAVEFLYSFGWFVWLMIEGSGEKCPTISDDIEERLRILEDGRFPDYPDNLRAIMIICWTVQANDDLKILDQSWKDCFALLKENPMEKKIYGNNAIPSLRRCANIPPTIYDDEYYATNKTSATRGMCLIICNEFFNHHAPREGALADKSIMRQCFTMFQYEVIVKDNLGSQDMKNKISEFTDKIQSIHDSAVVCIMSHGNEKECIGSNSYSIKWNDLLSPLYNCEALRGKPKLVFIQACRGSKSNLMVSKFLDHDKTIINMPTLESTLPDENNRRIIPEEFGSAYSLEADILLAQSTIPEHKSFRSIDASGSYFIQTLAKRLLEVGKSSDILHILTSVTKTVNEKAFEEMKCHQIASFESRLLKLFKF